MRRCIKPQDFPTSGARIPPRGLNSLRYMLAGHPPRGHKRVRIRYEQHTRTDKHVQTQTHTPTHTKTLSIAGGKRSSMPSGRTRRLSGAWQLRKSLGGPATGRVGRKFSCPSSCVCLCVRRSAQLNPLIAGHALSGRPGPAFNGLGSDRLSPSKLETSGVLFTIRQHPLLRHC